MNQKERERLREKFKTAHVSGGRWGFGFLEGLQHAEKHYEKPKQKIILTR